MKLDAKQARAAAWICHKCAIDCGAKEIKVHFSTWHRGKCPVCKKTDFVTEPRDFKWPKEVYEIEEN